MFMPRWVSRLTLVVTEVRVEHLQDISEDDARAEGMAVTWSGNMAEGPSKFADENFAELWDSLNAKRGYGWDTNPWVVAITFTVHQSNIDAMTEREAA
ncbi:hypothetical protein DYI37_03980 [Fulvimarina endophytica]|uniref:Uncharacterized protein n=2 Tax=Fulvimarina endophytica TaxID=2293836 RepID=A0A371X734_9HYPH|nr:hypothetical protein DYI37_03980 [Fulvimarina endophytica]